MKVGTKSVLFGAHCFFIHPWFVAYAWWKLYGFPKDWKLWIVFFFHDIGYWGKKNMDGKEGEVHPETGASIAHRLLDNWCYPYIPIEEINNNDLWEYVRNIRRPYTMDFWYRFSLYHSRFYSKKSNVKYSPLCVADKLAVSYEPWWFYLPRAILSGEIKEYIRDGELGASGKGKYANEIHTKIKYKNKREWFKMCKSMMRTWALEHQYGKEDKITLNQ